jgi:hypothetical protein
MRQYGWDYWRGEAFCRPATSRKVRPGGWRRHGLILHAERTKRFSALVEIVLLSPPGCGRSEIDPVT